MSIIEKKIKMKARKGGRRWINHHRRGMMNVTKNIGRRVKGIQTDEIRKDYSSII